MLKTIKFIKEHQSNWRELLSQAPYFLTIKEEEHFALLKYDQINSDFNEAIVKECRGLIIDKNTLEPVALSFYKFFNVQESLADKIDWNTAKVQEKIDGSKILVWYDGYKEDWRISTSGMLNAFEATVNDFGDTFGDLFCEALTNINCTLKDFYEILDPCFCYTFELVSPKSKIVVTYDKTKLYFTGYRQVALFNEFNPDLEDVIMKLGIERPKEYSLASLNDCLKATEKMAFNEEGFVVVDANWNRVKIKSPAYVAAHHLRENRSVNRKRLLEIVETNEVDEFLSYFPEYEKYVDELINMRDKLYNHIFTGATHIKEETNKIPLTNRKHYAMLIMKDYKTISPFLFKFIDCGLTLRIVFEMWHTLPSNKKLEYLDNYKNKEEN